MIKKGIFHSLINQKGQALLIIVLVMVVALTVGLSVASRTIVNLRNTQQQASSQKALSAAEAGIEQAIKSVSSCTGTCANGNFAGNTTYSTTVAQVDGTTNFLLNGGSLIPKDDAIYVWTSPWNADPTLLWQTPWNGNLTLFWGNSGQNCASATNPPAALEVSIITGPEANPVLSRRAFDPCPTRAGTNHFDTSSVSANGTTISGITPLYRTTMNGLSNVLLIRVNPIYSASYIGASGSVALPPQGRVITSTGTSDSSTTRKVTVYQGYPEVPTEFFPYTLFSP